MAIGSNNRYENLDGLKVIAAFGIVAMHVSSNMGHPLTKWKSKSGKVLHPAF